MPSYPPLEDPQIFIRVIIEDINDFSIRTGSPILFKFNDDTILEARNAFALETKTYDTTILNRTITHYINNLTFDFTKNFYNSLKRKNIKKMRIELDGRIIDYDFKKK